MVPLAETAHTVPCMSTKPRRACWMPTSTGRPAGRKTTVEKAAASRKTERPV